jgi:hypothetical protein
MLKVLLTVVKKLSNVANSLDVACGHLAGELERKRFDV